MLNNVELERQKYRLCGLVWRSGLTCFPGNEGFVDLLVAFLAISAHFRVNLQQFLLYTSLFLAN